MNTSGCTLRAIRMALTPTLALLAALVGSPLTAQEIDFPLDTTITSEHTVTVRGEEVPYTAEVGTQPVWGEDGEIVATMFYTYYERSDVTDRGNRPIMISFNGGPGSGSLWMHIGYTGPVQLIIDDEGYPVQPFGVRENPSSIIDVADIVFVNPVNVGYSRIVGDADRSQFFGINEDVEYLANWIDTWITRHERWRSPKFLIGESYGTTRVSGLAGRLQNGHWMYLNGVILVSPTGLGIDRAGPVRAALGLPNFTATAWYHEALAPDLQQRDLEDLLPEVEEWTIQEYLPALARGGSLPEARRLEIAEQVARYSGLSSQFVLDYSLAPSVSVFRKELLRDRGLTVGRLDARYRGVDRENAGETYDTDPALSAWNQAFAPAINHYMRTVLGWETDLQYYLFGPVHPWNREGDETGRQLQAAMSQNPYLHLFVQSGYYDGGTDYFSAKYTMWSMDPSGRLQDRMRFEAYRSGHMMYLRAEDIVTSNQDIRDFIAWALEATEVPARN